MTQTSSRHTTPVIVGVAGGSGSGKTTVVRRIVEKLGPERVACIQHDSYYLDRSDLSPEDRANVNYDHPDSLDTQLLVKHLTQLLAGNCASLPIYDFGTHLRMPDTVEVKPHQVILVEGILVLVEETLRDLMDIKVFVDTDADLRVLRRLERDLSVRERTIESVVRQYLETVRPMHLEFVEPSSRYADIIIQEGGYNEVAIEMLVDRIESIA